MNRTISITLTVILILLSSAFAQNVIKYQITDDGTELSVGTAVKVNGSNQITACGDNDSDAIGIITEKETSGGTRYYLVNSSDVALAPLPSTVSAGDKLTTTAGGGLTTASAGEIIVAIALEDGDGNALTLEQILITLDYPDVGLYISNQYTTSQSADFWIDGDARTGHLIVDSSAVMNESGGNYDFRIEGDTEQNLFFVDASADMVGIGTNAPSQKLDVAGSVAISGGIYDGTSFGTSGYLLATDGASDIYWTNNIPPNDNDYIWNQYSAAQSANFWIDGIGRVDTLYTPYLELGNQTANYSYIRLMQSPGNYFAGLMWNNSSATYGDGDDFSIFSYGGRDITIQPNGGNTYILSGNVGINTTSPGTAKLYVNYPSGTGGTDYGIRSELVANAGNDYGIYSNLNNSGGGTGYGIYSNVTGGANSDYGLYSNVVAGSGTDYNTYLMLNNLAGGIGYGIYNRIDGSSSTDYGMYIYMNGNTGTDYGIFIYAPSNADADYGIRIDRATRGIYSQASSYGGYFRDNGGTSYGYVGYGSYGVYARGNLMGGYFRDNNSSGYGYIGYGNYGVYSYGNSYGVYARGRTAGGYFRDVNSTGYAYVGYSTRKVWGSGTVSEIIPTKQYGRITLTCPEAPEYWYFDFGTDTLSGDSARVNIDEILKYISFIDERNPARVFVQARNSNVELTVRIDTQGFTVCRKPQTIIEDMGHSEMRAGRVHIKYASAFRKALMGRTPNIMITPIGSDKLFATASMPKVDEIGELFVLNVDTTGFDVVQSSLSGESEFFWRAAIPAIAPNDTIVFDWFLVLKPKTNYGEGRFPQAPGPAELGEDIENGIVKPDAARAMNVPDYDKIWRWEPDWKVYGYSPDTLNADIYEKDDIERAE